MVFYCYYIYAFLLTGFQNLLCVSHIVGKPDRHHGIVKRLYRACITQHFNCFAFPEPHLLSKADV